MTHGATAASIRLTRNAMRSPSIRLTHGAKNTGTRAGTQYMFRTAMFHTGNHMSSLFRD
jgi:hypothetical protein